MAEQAKKLAKGFRDNDATFEAFGADARIVAGDGSGPTLATLDAGLEEALNAGLIRSILQGAGNRPGIWLNALPTTRQRANRQPQIDPQAPPRPGESWDAYWQRLRKPPAIPS